MRRTPLTRRTPLGAKSELKRTAALGRSPLARSALHADPVDRRQQRKRRTARNTGPSDAVVIQVAQRDEWSCVRCGSACHGQRGVDWSVQHRRARGMGGSRRPDTNQPQNLILLCGSATTGCHGSIESNKTDAISNGWALKSNSDPLQAPVAHWQRGLIFLTADGSWSSRPPTTAEEASPVTAHLVDEALDLHPLHDGPAGDDEYGRDDR